MNKIRQTNLKWYFFQFGIKNFVPLIALPIFTRYISLNDFGIYALAIFYGIIVSGIINLGLLTIYERTFFELCDIKRKNLLFTLIIFVFSLFIFSVLLTIYFDLTIAEFFFKKEELKNYLLLALCFQTFKSLNLYFLSYFKNYEKAQIHTYVSVGESILSILIALIFVTYYSMGLKGFILGQTMGVLIMFVLVFVFVFIPFKSKFEFQLLIQQLKLSFPLTPRIFFGIINNQFDRYMLGILNTLSSVGLYDIGQKIANISFVFMTAIENSYSPEVYRRLFSKDKKHSQSIGSFLTPFFYLSIFFCLVIGLFSYEILYILTPIDFHSASPIVSILVLLYGIYFFGKQPQLLFAKKTALISFLTFISIALNIIFNIPMIKYFGIIGAACGTVIAGLISSSISFYFGQKHTPIIYEKTILIILIYFKVVILINLFFGYLNIEYFLILIYKIMSVIIFLSIGKILKIINTYKIRLFLRGFINLNY